MNTINVDHCGESQGCLIVPQKCNNEALNVIMHYRGKHSMQIQLNFISLLEHMVLSVLDFPKMKNE